MEDQGGGGACWTEREKLLLFALVCDLWFGPLSRFNLNNFVNVQARYKMICSELCCRGSRCCRYLGILGGSLVSFRHSLYSETMALPRCRLAGRRGCYAQVQGWPPCCGSLLQSPHAPGTAPQSPGNLRSPPSARCSRRPRT